MAGSPFIVLTHTEGRGMSPQSNPHLLEMLAHGGSARNVAHELLNVILAFLAAFPPISEQIIRRLLRRESIFLRTGTSMTRRRGACKLFIGIDRLIQLSRSHVNCKRRQTRTIWGTYVERRRREGIQYMKGGDQLGEKGNTPLCQHWGLPACAGWSSWPDNASMSSDLYRRRVA